MILDLDTTKELRGTAMTVTPAGTTSFVYGPLGAAATSGSHRAHRAHWGETAAGR